MDVAVVAAQFRRQDLFFLAGAVAYFTLLTAVPFVLLLTSAAGYLLGSVPAGSNAAMLAFLEQLMPRQTAAAALPLVQDALAEVQARRGPIGVVAVSLLALIATWLFAALRNALVLVFDIERARGFVAGKLLDLVYVAVGTLAVTVYLGLAAVVVASTETGATFLQAMGFRREALSFLEFMVARITSTAFLVLMFAGLYKFVPNRRVPWQSALWGGVWCAVLFELARGVVFGLATNYFNPASLYTGTLAVVVLVVFWVYYAAVVFLIGGVVARVHEVRTARRHAGQPTGELPADVTGRV